MGKDIVMKKIILVILSILLCFSMLVSCANDAAVISTEEIVNSIASENSKEEQIEKQVEEQISEAHKAEPKIEYSAKELETVYLTSQQKSVEPTVNINGKISKWTLSGGICQAFRTQSTVANTKFDVNIPVSEVGSYTLKFNTKLGLTRTYTSGSKTASLALPKTVFQVGEPIPVMYASSGLDSSVDARPWIAITKNVGGLDKYVNWEYVEANYSYALNAAAMTGQREDNTVKSYVNLPAGEYKIYFIAGGAANTRDKNYWLLNEPINISIVPKGSTGTKITRSGTAYGSASLTVGNNIFRQGESIYASFTASNLKTPYSTYQPWIAMSKTFVEGSSMNDYYTHWYYTKTTDSGSCRFDKNSGNYAQGGVSVNVEAYRTLPEGSYKIHYVNGPSFQDCVNYVEPIGINIAPVVTLNASVGGASVLSTDDSYDNQTVNKTINVTEADVEKGYVTISFSFGSLKANTNYYLTVNSVSLTKNV